MSNNTEALIVKLIECWNCHKFVSESSIMYEDGYCPICDQPIDLDDKETSND